MSYSTVLGVTPGQRPQYLAELRNSWGWAASIWGRLTRHHGLGDWLTNQQGLDRLGHQIDDLPEWQQAPLVLTFDTGVIPWQAFGWAAEQLDEFERRLPAPENHANHVPAVAELLRSAPKVPLVGIYVTSVSENPFDPWDEEADAPGSGIPLRAMYLLRRHWDLVPEYEQALKAGGDVTIPHYHYAAYPHGQPCTRDCHTGNLPRVLEDGRCDGFLRCPHCHPPASPAQQPSPERGDVSDDTSPHLLDQLRELGDTYGPLGVALAAAGLTDASVLVGELCGPVVTVERTDADVMRWEAKMHWPGRTPMVGLGATIPDAFRDVADSIEHDAIEEATAMWLSSRSAPTSSPLAGEAT